MNTEQAWRTWWDAEGKHMNRLPHHDAVDHMASVTRIAWLNGAFEAAEEIERLRSQVEHHARDRVEYANAWSKWIEENDGLEIAEWCRAYADAVPYPNPDGPEIVRTIHSRLDARHRMAASEIERLRDELTASHESHGNEVAAIAERLDLAILDRDRARREMCMAKSVIRWDLEHPNIPDRSQTQIILLAWQIADELGWDCFKGEKAHERRT